MPFAFVISTSLWFDVEKRYNTTGQYNGYVGIMLWFDVEKRYNTTKTLQK